MSTGEGFHPYLVKFCSATLTAIVCSAAESQQRWTYLQENAASESTQMIIAADSASLGERYAALCAACSRGEAIRDSGGHSLVILDDISSMVSPQSKYRGVGGEDCVPLWTALRE